MPLTHIGFFRATLLGALNAIFFAGVLFVAEKIVGYVGWPRVWFFWGSVCALLILCFAPTSYLLHRFVGPRTNSPVVLWVVIGLVSVLIWNVLFAVSAYWSWHEHNHTVEYYEMANPRNPQFGLFSLALVVVTNLIFAAALRTLTQRTLAGSP